MLKVHCPGSEPALAVESVELDFLLNLTRVDTVGRGGHRGPPHTKNTAKEACAWIKILLFYHIYTIACVKYFLLFI